MRDRTRFSIGVRCLLAVGCAGILALAPLVARAATIVDTRHNLSVTGPGTIKAQSETRVCIFCHTPHNANPKTPLWNREVGSGTYTLYANPTTLQATPAQPSGPSRLCLSCHDGMIALGAVLQPAGSIAMSGGILPGSPSIIGGAADLSKDHPLSFSYPLSAAVDPAIRTTPSGNLVLYGAGFIECPTCHDAHKDVYRTPDKSGRLTGKFLAADNRSSALCLDCHDLPGWIGSAHQMSAALVDPTVLPVFPKQWPTWPTVAEWGCESCHTAHSSQSGQQLLNYPTEAETCAPCHGAGGDPHSDMAGSANVIAQTAKLSGHRQDRLRTAASRKPSSLLQPEGSDALGVTCSDCHNTHTMTGRGRTSTPERGLAGSLKGVRGVDKTGAAVAAATMEYEVCFKCHADRTSRVPRVQRVVASTNTRIQFNPANASFHPVVGAGRNPTVPSLSAPLEPSLDAASTITCTSCHSDDNGVTRGPHGSSFPPILRERYETADKTPESSQSYALCYRCHSRLSIIADVSFRRKSFRTTPSGGGHSGHLAQGAPCATCHDAHGVPASTDSGDHTNLINFDVTVVAAAPGYRTPIYQQQGTFSGRCTLVCHGRVHLNESYP